jgi:hydroxyacylglutathione hydrolase
MIVQVFESGILSTNTMVLTCKASLHSAIIDPAQGCFSAIKSYISENKLKPQSIFLTHAHWDHVGDVLSLKEEYNIPVYIHRGDIENLRKPGSDGIPMLISLRGIEPDIVLEGQEKLKLGHLELEVIHTPGHSPGSVCYWFSAGKILISGDTLFQGSIGNISFPLSSAADMWTSLKKLSKLPLDTKVYPGHMGPTIIGEEHWLDQAEAYFG